jgi:hypothetical protein
MRQIDVDEQADELVDEGRWQTAQLIAAATDTRLTRRSLQQLAASERPSTRHYLDDEEVTE